MLPSMPFAQPDLLTMSPAVRALQAECPIGRVRTLTGDEAWMVTRHAELKRLFGERHLGRSHRDPEHAARISDSILIGALANSPRPADLHAALSVPLPVLVICELLGVPYEDRDQFRAWTQGMADMQDRQKAGEAMGRL